MAGSTRKTEVKSDLEIARAATLKPIVEIADKLGIGREHVLPFGHHKAKLDLTYLRNLKDKPGSKLILVTGISPTPAGEGKTTTTVGLGDALQRLGKKTTICLREPSLGPCFGVKGGAAGGGYAQVVPMEDINLHFTGDFHAITTAHNLLAALADNHIYWGNDLGLDLRRVAWRRLMDMNDRALRSIINSLGGVANGFPREDGFDITPASEVMAIFCLADSLEDLQKRLGNIVVGETRDRNLVRASDLKGSGPMTALLKEAIQPNLVQTLEHTPAFVHGGPFGNIAHGCNSIIATRAALKLADYVVTEAGFGSDLGAEKFFDIKCRAAGLKPNAVVLVATARALKMHGGVARADLGKENLAALDKGCANILRHIENLKGFGVPVVVGINRFVADTEAELKLVKDKVASAGVEAFVCTHWGDGSAGAEELARAVVKRCDAKSELKYLYPLDMPLWQKIETVARKIYRAGAVTAPDRVKKQIETYEQQGFRDMPVCMAKTQMSFSTDPTKLGAPEGHEVHVRDVRLSAGAGFLVAICGDIMTMPGLPKVPAAHNITVNEKGQIEGLF
jgi:formate--tetrahydrofolate ligase